MNIQSTSGNRTGTLASGTAVETFDVSIGQNLCIVIKNTGNNGMTVAVTKSPLGTLFGSDSALGAAIGTIAAGATSPAIELAGIAFSKMRFTFTGTSGDGYIIELAGK